MVEEADPSKWLVRNMNADLVDKEKWVYTPSPKVSLLLDQRESLVNSGQRK